jgi:hypothetical protein
MRALLASVLALAACLAVVPAARAQSSNRYLNAAMKLYADLEYESALDNLKKARDKGGLTDDEDIQSSLYMGLLQVELGNPADAESAFKAALALKCEIALPKTVSPKAVAMFEKARKDIWKGSTCPPPKVVVVKPKPEPGPGPVDIPGPTPPVVQQEAPSGSRTIGLAISIPLMVIGLGVAGGGGYFGAQAGDYTNKMNDPATWQNEVLGFKSKADDAARSANIMYGVGAGLAVAGAVALVVTLATTSGGDVPSTVGSETPGR